MNWLGQEITAELFLKNGWCFLTGSTFEVVSLHLNSKVCHWTIEVCDSWRGSAVNKRDSLRESSKCAPFCQRKCGVFYGKFEVQNNSFHRTRFYFTLDKVLFIQCIFVLWKELTLSDIAITANIANRL